MKKDKMVNNLLDFTYNGVESRWSMFVKFSEKAQKALVVAESCAYQFSSQEVTTEHLLFALLKMPDLSFTKCLKKYFSPFVTLICSVYALKFNCRCKYSIIIC